MAIKGILVFASIIMALASIKTLAMHVIPGNKNNLLNVAKYTFCDIKTKNPYITRI